MPPLFSRVDGRDPAFEDTPDVVSREAGREAARLLPADDPPWISRDCGRDPAGCHSHDCGRIDRVCDQVPVAWRLRQASKCRVIGSLVWGAM